MKKKINQTALILGAGLSGISAANLLIAKGYKIWISDSKDKIKLPNKMAKYLINEKEASKKMKEIVLAVKSPGISPNHFLIKKLKEAKIPVYSEIDLSLMFSKAKRYIMITGTNGKTTTTTLTYLIMKNFLKQKNARAIVCGNIGKPVSKQILNAKENDWLIMEASSYQLEDSKFIKPAISAILNITPDHIEHHGNMEKYIEAKMNIFKNQDKNDFCIMNYEDKILRKISKNCGSNILWFSSKERKGINAYFQKGKIVINLDKKNYEINPPDIPGLHNIENVMASCLCSIKAGCDLKTLQYTLDKFNGIEHRIEFVRKIKGISYINDSKATNVDSTFIALKALGKKKNILLIMGGLGKGTPYSPLTELIKKYVKAIYLIGKDADNIEKQLKGICPMYRTENIKKTVNMINETGEEGDIALLSPACASYDQFKNFEDRGKKFKKIVNALK
jgi:UDP-N-acetylmuramoylalanine--D-glutamate ligase